jgi:hypothetical protein
LATGAGAWLAIAAWFVIQGTFAHFWEAVVAYNSYYAGSMGRNLAAGMLPQNIFTPVLAGYVPAAVLSLGALVLKPSRPTAQILAGALMGSWLAVALPGRFHWHYYQLLMPFVVIGAGIGAALLLRRAGLVAAFAVVVALCVSAFIQLPGQMKRDESLIRYMHGTDARYIAQHKVTPVILAELRPGETLYQMGSQAAYYIEAGISPPTGVLGLKHIIEGPAAERLTAMVMSDLHRERPAIVIFDSIYATFFPRHQIYDWLAANYEPRADLSMYPRALVYTRRDRMRSMPSAPDPQPRP